MSAHMDVSENSGTPKSCILIGFSIINHPFWGTPTFGNTHMLLLVVCLMIKRVCFYDQTSPWKKKTLFGKSLSLFKKSPALRGNSWNFVKKKLVTFRKFHQKKRQNLGCPNAQWDLWRCHPTQFWRKDVTASPRIPPKHPKALPDILSYL